MSYTTEEIDRLESLMTAFVEVAARFEKASAASQAFVERVKDERDRLDAEWIAARDAMVASEHRMFREVTPIFLSMLKRQRDAARAGEAR